MKNKILFLHFLISICFSSLTHSQAIRLEKTGTRMAYFTYNGQPLLSFGGGAGDGMFWLSEDAFDYKNWANWEADFGMNHSRDYPPLSWKGIEIKTKENGGKIDNVLFPYEETSRGSRLFDLTKFNDEYWQKFRAQCKYLESKGIIIHLLMWNGWQTNPDFPENISWKYHFFNPDHNVNEFTEVAKNDWREIYYSVENNNSELVAAQKAWFEKLVEMTYDLDNVYYDLVHEFGDLITGGDLKTAPSKRWIEAMALAVRAKWESLNPDRPIILGMDAGANHLNWDKETPDYIDWIYSRPYFDVLIFGKIHKRERAIGWRVKYKKPYIGQEAWDENGVKYSVRVPEDHNHMRKYFWKFMMFKCQQMDLYHKPRKGRGLNVPGYDLNYNPYGINQFEKHALVLREFFNSIKDYENLWFQGEVKQGPGIHQYVLSSDEEVIIYLSSATGQENILYPSETLVVDNLSLIAGKRYTLEVFDPKKGVISKRSYRKRKNANATELQMELPGFTDDLVIHVY